MTSSITEPHHGEQAHEQVKHTPGPWQQHDNVYPYGPSYAATVWGPEGPGHGLIADCRQSLLMYEAVANARLIAAAPELLAAIKRLMKRPECQCSHNANPGMAAAIDEAICAVAKAEGRSP